MTEAQLPVLRLVDVHLAPLPVIAPAGRETHLAPRNCFSIQATKVCHSAGTTVHHPAAEEHGGGLYTFRSIRECLDHDMRILPRVKCAALHHPRAVVKLLAW